MKISIEWIKELLPALDATADEIATRLSKSGFEVEGVTRIADAFQNVVVGHVRAVDPHPDADSIRVTKVFDGENELTVVCGAPNVAKGQKVAFAKIGAKLPNGMEIARRKIRGVESEGMICSESELGFSDESDGIIVLDGSAKAGRPIARVLGLEDVVLEIAVTPNRPDALSHFGMARELAALFDVRLKEPRAKLREVKAAATSAAKIELASDRCAKYVGRVIRGVKVGPSPAWVEKRLRAVGSRSISNVVDATNLALLELGHPLHAFDLATLSGAKIIVRQAADGEKLVTLDKAERALTADDLVIADAEKAVALAGVMGGLHTEVTAGTTDILLEAALFDPSSVRRTARRTALHTEASHRFERGVDAEAIERAADRCAELIVELAGGEVLRGYTQAKKKLPARPVVGVRPARAALVLGRDVEAKEVKSTMKKLGFESRPPKKGYLYFRSPSWRVDISREEDLIEEVARVAGFDEIPTLMPPMTGKVWEKSIVRDPERRVRELLAHRGFLEAISLAFNARAHCEAFGIDLKNAVEVANPLGEESALMRRSLLPSLLRAARHNQDVLPSISDLRMFEIGNTFEWDSVPAQLPVEQKHIALLFRGHRLPESWAAKDAKGVVPQLDAFDVKASVEVLLNEFRIQGARFVPADDLAWLHPRSATRVVLGEEELGVFGELHPDVMGRFGLEGAPVFVADLLLDALARREGGHARFVPLARHPPARRDLSFFVEKTVSAEKILAAVRGGVDHLESVEIFDVYEGKDAAEKRRSIAVAMVFRAPDRTLTDAEVEAKQASIISALQQHVGAEIRSGGS